MSNKSIPSHAEPAMIAWCMKQARVTSVEVADKLSLSDTEVKFWEYGEGPTLTQLRALAKFLRFPTATFYLPKPPKWHPIRDYRRLPASERDQLSRELAYWTRIAQGRMEWLADFFESQKQRPLQIVGSAKLSDSPITVGADLRKWLDVSLQKQKSIKDIDKAFRMWRKRCEEKGVAVFMTRKVPITEMRGFAISHPLAPVVAINNNDKGGGRVFSLMHEIAHVMLGLSGISDIGNDRTAKTNDDKVEIFCNAVAAEVLMPTDDFRAESSRFEHDYEQSISALSELYGVSQEAIARRLRDHGLIKQDNFLRIASEIRERGEAAAKKKIGIIKIKQARKVLNTVGRRLGESVVSAYRDNEITGAEVSDLLDMKVQFLPEFEKQLFG